MKISGAIATSIAVLAVVLCVMAALMGLPTAVEIATITVSGLLLVAAGAVVGVGIASQKKSTR